MEAKELKRGGNWYKVIKYLSIMIKVTFITLHLLSLVIVSNKFGSLSLDWHGAIFVCPQQKFVNYH